MTPLRLPSALACALAALAVAGPAVPVAAAQSAAAARPVADRPPRTLPELERRLRHLLDSTGVPGMGLAIVRHDTVVYTGGLGLARLAPATPATDRTLFRIGSTSKSFVALTVMALAREGKLSLADRLADRLPGFPFRNPWEATDPVRVVHLLEHTTGWGDNSFMAYSWSDPALPLEKALRDDSLTHVSRWRPGTRFSYSNTGPAVAALLVEKIEGIPFEQVVQARWFTPLGMTTATYFHPDTTRTPMATLHEGTPPVAQRYWHLFARPAGSINASARDMAAYLRFLLGRGTVDGRTLLAREDLERIERHESSLAARAGLRPGYGLHLVRAADSTGFVWREHGGAVNGGLSDLAYLPEHGVGYAFQINSGDHGAMALLKGAVRGFVTAGLAPLAPEPAVVAVPATTRDFTGWYRPVSPRAQRLYGVERVLGVGRIVVGDSGLSVAPLFGPARRFLAVDGLRFRRPGEREATLALMRDDANGRPLGIEDVVGGMGTSYARVGALDALGSVVVAILALAGLGLGLVAMAWGGIRRLAARVRARPFAPAPARAAWRWLAVLGALALAWVLLLTGASSDLAAIGTFNWRTASMWVLGWGFLLVSLVSLVALVRGRGAAAVAGGWARTSLTVARALHVATAATAGYLAWWGIIGWRPWAG